MKPLNIRLMSAVAMTAAMLSLPLVAYSAGGEEALLEQVRTGQVGDQAAIQKRIASFKGSSDLQKQERYDAAVAERDALQAQSQALELSARENKAIYTAKINELRTTLGPTANMFGILQQTATDLIGIFRSSATSIEYPDREKWLTDFIGRMNKSSEIFTLDEIKKLWFLIQQETTASGQIVKVSTEVLARSGGREQREVVRIGKFNLVTDTPEPLYLAWQAESQRASVLKRQPDDKYLGQVDDFLSADGGVQAVGIDPTGGSLLTRLVDAPTLGDRVEAGGLIGNLILLLGAFAVLIAIYKLVEITLVSIKVDAQRRNPQSPDTGNPLGRLLKIYESNKDVDTETLEMRLGEGILEERPKVDRFVGLLKVIAVVAPLMGLMGTVLGMIATFQAITLFGTGDPKTMAGGISQALVTTVEGLTVAIPVVLLHAIVAARAKSVVNTLKHQTAGLIAERMEGESRSAA